MLNSRITVPVSSWLQVGELGCPETEDGESRLPSSEAFLVADLGADVNLHAITICCLKTLPDQ